MIQIDRTATTDLHLNLTLRSGGTIHGLDAIRLIEVPRSVSRRLPVLLSPWEEHATAAESRARDGVLHDGAGA